MNTQEAREVFRKARGCMEQGQFQESLPYWEELCKAFPKERDVLFGAAYCLEQAGNLKEARRLAERLAQLHHDPRANEFLERIPPQEKTAPPKAAAPAPPPIPAPEPVQAVPEIPAGADAIPGMDVNLLDDFDMAPRKPLPPTQAMPSGGGANWPLITIWGLTFVFVVGYIVSYVKMMSATMNVIQQGTAPLDFSPISPLMGVFFLVAGIFMYAAFSYSIKCICEKAGVEAGCMAWAPILQMIPLAKAADLGCLLTGALFIPPINFLVGIYLFYRLCQVCDKSPLWILLVLVPGGPILFLSYLGLSE